VRILVVNSGSSSVKLRLFDLDGSGASDTQEPGPAMVQGAVTGIGGMARLELRAGDAPAVSTKQTIADHPQAIGWLFEQWAAGSSNPATLVDAVGHRVVHGGEQFSAPVLIDGDVVADIDALAELAPLHNPACLAGIRAARQVLGHATPMVAVFDTAFHRDMPEHARRYALPTGLAERHGIWRYGFHGLAHASMLDSYLRASCKPRDEARVITLQLGNGCSAAAIDGGRSIDTSMGFTPLEGLVMGTRSGDLDPSIVSYLCDKEGTDPAEVERRLNEESGLLGLSGRSNDMRDLQAAVMQEKHEPSMLAIQLFCYRAKKYAGAYLAALGGADAIVFGGGIGEAAPDIRNTICEGMDWCGLVIDAERNSAATGLVPGQAARISADGAQISAYVVATDEERWIARETRRCLQAAA
jgi:acetate kinase